MIPPRWFLRAGWAIHKAVFAVSGGRIGTRPSTAEGGLGWCFLTTRGRTTGQPRRVGLYYVDDGPNLGVVASNAGAPEDPGWWRNLQAEPAATVELGGTARPVVAREATPDERARVWGRFTAALGSYREYEAATDRRIAVVILEPDGRRARGGT